MVTNVTNWVVPVSSIGLYSALAQLFWLRILCAY